MKRFNKMTEMQMSKKIGGAFHYAIATGVFLAGASAVGLAYDITTTATSDKN